MVTASYYLNNNDNHTQFKTELFLDGIVEGDVLHGDLYFKGHGDPTLKTDDLSLFIDSVKNLGITKVEGKLFYDNSYLPDVNYINRNQLRSMHITQAWEQLTLMKTAFYLSGNEWKRKI